MRRSAPAGGCRTAVFQVRGANEVYYFEFSHPAGRIVVAYSYGEFIFLYVAFVQEY